MIEKALYPNVEASKLNVSQLSTLQIDAPTIDSEVSRFIGASNMVKTVAHLENHDRKYRQKLINHSS